MVGGALQQDPRSEGRDSAHAGGAGIRALGSVDPGRRIPDFEIINQLKPCNCYNSSQLYGKGDLSRRVQVAYTEATLGVRMAYLWRTCDARVPHVEGWRVPCRRRIRSASAISGLEGFILQWSGVGREIWSLKFKKQNNNFNFAMD